jgi:hypothetical protein
LFQCNDPNKSGQVGGDGELYRPEQPSHQIQVRGFVDVDTGETERGGDDPGFDAGLGA